MKDRLLRLPAVLDLIPVSKSAWWAGIKSGKYPPGIKLGPRTRAWAESSILSTIEKFKTASKTNGKDPA